MLLERISIINYKNIEEAELDFSPNVNCLIGANGMGKTNVLDAIYYLSFCKSSSSALDGQIIRHNTDFFMLQGDYLNDNGSRDKVHCGVKLGNRKRLKRNDKDYKRLAEHIGMIPLVLISPSDSLLISGGSDERRRFMNAVISQYNPAYLDSVLRYDKALKQRNVLLKQEEEPDSTVLGVLEEMMSVDAEIIYQERKSFIDAFIPIFRQLYEKLCGTEREEVDILYESHGERGALKEQLEAGRTKERIVGYTLHGVHKDELLLLLNGYPVRREASQGQTKTYFIAMKLAQFIYLKHKGEQRMPILLLDDVFDKLDTRRVSKIVDYVSGNEFGQIFITDTNREHLDRILEATQRDYKLFHVEEGKVV